MKVTKHHLNFILLLTLVACTLSFLPSPVNETVTTNVSNPYKSSSKSQDTIRKHVPITAFWFNGGWNHYDADALKYLDEIIIFAIAPNPENGDLFKFDFNPLSGETTYKRNRGAGLTTTMIQTIVKDARKNNVKVTLGINAMGKKNKIFNALVINQKQGIFADSILSFCQKYKIDAVDVDYEHPANDDDVSALGSIFKALSKKLKPHDIQISGAFGIQREYTRKFLKQYNELIDQVNIMCYLKPVEWFKRELNLLHTELGIPKHKIYGGIAFYAKDKKAKVSIDYRDLIEITTVTNNEDSFKITNPNKPEQTLNLQFNNSELSLIKKVEFIRDNDFGGIMIWALNHDVSTANPNSRLRFLRTITNGQQ